MPMFVAASAGTSLLASAQMRSRPRSRRWLAVGGSFLAVFLAPQVASAQITIDPTVTPTRPPDNFVNWFAYGTLALGVLIALAILAAYLRFSTRFFGEREERGPRIGTPAPPVVTVGQMSSSQPQALAASLTRPPLPVRQSPVPGGAASAGQASGVATERAPTPAASPTPVAERPAGPVAEGRPEAPTGPAVETQPQADAPGKVTKAPAEAEAEPEPSEPPQEEEEATVEAATPGSQRAEEAEAEQPVAEAEQPAAEAEQPAAEATAASEAEQPAAEAETAQQQPQATQPAPEPEPAAPARPAGGADLDQETYDRVLQEQLGKGLDRRVAEGKARSAAVKAARAKSEA
jgi:hypothetical protein